MAKAKTIIEDPKIDSIWKVIESTVLGALNKEPMLFGSPKHIVTVDMLRNKGRKKEIVVSRQLCYYFAMYVFNDVLNDQPGRNKVNYMALASRYDQDHATVIHSIETIKKYRDTERQILRLILSCIDKILGKIKDGSIRQPAHKYYDWLYPKSEIY
jgi:hypothetical protein